MAVDAPQYQWLKANTAATFAVRGGAGLLHAVTVNTKGAGSTVSVYDANNGTTNPIAVIDSANNAGTFFYDAAVLNGITVVIAGGTPDITVLYK